MNSDEIAIKVKNISKRYRIGLKADMHDSITSAAIDLIKRPLENYRKYRSLYKFDDIEPTLNSKQDDNVSDIIWALRDVSFEVKKSDVLGIIGSNGAGKSTLLKILTKISEPTSGFAEIHGRVSSLLEVGTGFHPELTGRENIYLNGVILGMTKAEIKKKFDEILAFSGVEKFIDTPVKRYSSGMSVRLAFSVAAHLEPEILLIDEVLAVGDAEFQKKCLKKMDGISKQGRTILFVSHNMGAIENLCTSAIWIDGGKIVASGEVETIIDEYLKSAGSTNEEDINLRKIDSSAEAIFADIKLLDTKGTLRNNFRMGETIVVEFDVEFYKDFESVEFSLQIKRLDLGMKILHMINQDGGYEFHRIPKGKRRVRVEIPNCLLYPGSYNFTLWMGIRGRKDGLDILEDVLGFTMVQSKATQRTTPLSYSKHAIFFMPSKWQELTLVN